MSDMLSDAMASSQDKFLGGMDAIRRVRGIRGDSERADLSAYALGVLSCYLPRREVAGVLRQIDREAERIVAYRNEHDLGGYTIPCVDWLENMREAMGDKALLDSIKMSLRLERESGYRIGGNDGNE